MARYLWYLTKNLSNFFRSNEPEIIININYLYFRNSIYGSAICSYNMSGLHEAFRGPFTFQEDAKMVWTSVENSILPEHQQVSLNTEALV